MLVSEKITITDSLVRSFAEVSGDFNPIHLDESYSEKTRFGKRIAHGMLLCSFFSRLIAEKYPGPGSIYLQQSISFKSPCFIDDTVRVEVSLLKNDGRKYLLSTRVLKDDSNLILVEGQATVLV